MVCVIRLRLPANSVGAKTLYINKKYAPRLVVNGVYTSSSTGADNGKVIAADVDSNGKIGIWITTALVSAEGVTFVYPIRQVFLKA